ncbi:hypothetical protein ABZV15_09895 [Streptomyces sp. NPDC005246]
MVGFGFSAIARQRLGRTVGDGVQREQDKVVQESGADEPHNNHQWFAAAQ